jgi:ParB-like chromosome segregation protein Spo0J
VLQAIGLKIELEFHQLDLRYECLRRREPEREKRLIGSLSQRGQQVPIVVVSSGVRFVVVDGYKRVRGLKRLGSDTVRATVSDLSEPEVSLITVAEGITAVSDHGD